MTRWCKRLAVLLVVVGMLLPVAGLAQPPTASGSLYSIWVRLSLRGFNQEEIESLLRNMDPKALEAVKVRLRQTVLSNLELKNIGTRYRASRDSDDLRNVRFSVETEIRFAGLQSDEKLRQLIKERFGIRLSSL